MSSSGIGPQFATFNIGGSSDWVAVETKNKLDAGENPVINDEYNDGTINEAKDKLKKTLKILTENCPIVCLQETHTDDAIELLNDFLAENPNLTILYPSLTKTYGELRGSTAIIIDKDKFEEVDFENDQTQIDRDTLVVKLTLKATGASEAKTVLVSSAWLQGTNPFNPDKGATKKSTETLNGIISKMDELDPSGQACKIIGMDSNLSIDESLTKDKPREFTQLYDAKFKLPTSNPKTVWNRFLAERAALWECVNLKKDFIMVQNEINALKQENAQLSKRISKPKFAVSKSKIQEKQDKLESNNTRIKSLLQVKDKLENNLNRKLNRADKLYEKMAIREKLESIGTEEEKEELDALRRDYDPTPYSDKVSQNDPDGKTTGMEDLQDRVCHQADFIAAQNVGPLKNIGINALGLKKEDIPSDHLPRIVKATYQRPVSTTDVKKEVEEAKFTRGTRPGIRRRDARTFLNKPRSTPKEKPQGERPTIRRRDARKFTPPPKE